MSKTDGMLLEKIHSLTEEKLRNLSFAAVVFWVLSPFIIMPFNALGLDGYNVVNIWITCLYISGGFGLLFGGLYLYKFFSVAGKLEKKDLESLEPLLLLLVFFVWCIIAVLFSKARRVGLYGYGVYRDNLFTYLFYGGMLLNGIVLSQSEKHLKKLLVIFILISTVLSLISLFDNDLIRLLTNNDYADEGIHRAAFLNADVFSMYLVLAVFASIVFYINTDRLLLKLMALAASIIQYVALMYTENIYNILIPVVVLFALLVISIIKKNPESRKQTLILICLFLVLLFLSKFVLKIVIESNPRFAGMSGPMIANPEDTMSSVLDLWKNGIAQISDFPVTGVGLQGTLVNSRNVFIQIGVYTGMIGLLLYLSVYLVFFKRIVKKQYELSVTVKSALIIVLAYILSSFAGETVFEVAAYYYFVFGIGLSVCLKQIFNLKDDDEIKEFMKVDQKINI